MKKLTWILIPLTVLANPVKGQEKAKIRETSVLMTTYLFSDPDPVPKPDIYYYPYFRFDGFASASTKKNWKVVELENDYIKVSIFPEIGGKIWGAIEKSTGHEFIYYNSVVKFRDIAMRGAWTSGGIELNFGIIGHAPTSATPVDYRIAENADGSVSCYVGALDMLTRTRWVTEINLENDKAYFTTTTTWHNPTPIIQPYYQWMNAAYQVEGDLEFCFPGNHWIGHGGDAHDWAIDPEGRDISWYKNNNFGGSKSNHVLGGISDHYAGYWHDLDFGSGHYASYGEKLGMKVFQWAHSRSGGIWEDLLTDNDGQYVEMQSGRLFNQAATSSTYTPFKHFGFEPYATDVFREYWFPILGTKGVRKASPVGILNLEPEGGEYVLYFCPLQKTSDSLFVYEGDKLKGQVFLDLEVLETWSMPIQKDRHESSLRIVLGKNKLVYSEAREDNYTNRPMQAPDDFDWNSAYGHYLNGQQWMYQRRYDRAESSFMECIAKDVYFAPALNQLAVLLYRKGVYQEALQFVRRALSVNAYDPEANFTYGLVNKKLGKMLDAEDGFSVALLAPSFRNAAYVELAKLRLAQGRLEAAKTYVQNILTASPGHLQGNQLMAVITREMGESHTASQSAENMLKVDALNHFAHFERMLITSEGMSKAAFGEQLHNEMPYETFMEMALWYEEVGGREEAIKLLELSPQHPMVQLELAYLYHLDGKDPAAFENLNKAMEASPSPVFPFRPEHLQVLDWAMENAESWKPAWYMALLHWHLGNLAPAKHYFTLCGEEPDYAPFYLTRFRFFNGQPGYEAEADLLKANNLAPDEWRTYAWLVDYYLSKNDTKKALDFASKSVKTFRDNDVVRYDYARSLMADGQYSACRKTLEQTTILPSEGARYGRVTYQQACLMEGIEQYRKGKFNAALQSIQYARQWPENLGVGKPYNVDERIENYFEAQCLVGKGNKQQAEQLFQKVIDYTEASDRSHNSLDYLYLKSLQATGGDERVKDFLDRWQNSDSEDAVMKWCRAMLEGNTIQAQSIASQINTASGGTPWDPRSADPEFEIVKALADIRGK